MIETIAAEKLIADRYQLLEEVGQGGMATVFRGQDLVLDREIAVKILHPHLARESEHRQRFRREARTIARLHHPNIVEIYDFSDQDSHSDTINRNAPTYLVMEFVEGYNLQTFLDKQEFPLCELAAAMVAATAEALEHAHAQNIIHRDLKPENVLICSKGKIKLTDFGLARILDNEAMTRTGSILGSPAYMAPEQIQGKLGDHRADIFALGIILYRLACHKHPFVKNNPAATLQAVSAVDYIDPERLKPGIGRNLTGIIRRALSANPDQRYPTVSAMHEDLMSYLHEVGIHQPNETLAAFFKNPQTEAERLRANILGQLKQRAYTLAANKKYSVALDRCNRALSLEPNDPDIDKLLERLSHSDSWYQQPRNWLYAGLAASVLVAVTWYAPVLWKSWMQPPEKKNAGEKHSLSHSMAMASRSLPSLLQRRTPPPRDRTAPTPRRKVAKRRRPPRRLSIRRSRFVLPQRAPDFHLQRKWRRYRLGNLSFQLRYAPGRRLSVRDLSDIKVTLDHQKPHYLEEKKKYTLRLKGSAPYKIILDRGGVQTAAWLHPPKLRPGLRRILKPKKREVEDPPKPRKPAYIISEEGEKDALPRTIEIKLHPFSKIHLTSGSLQKRRPPRGFHTLKLASNRYWRLHATTKHTVDQFWNIKIPNEGVPEAQLVSRKGKPLGEWTPLIKPENIPGYSLRAVLTFKSVFLRIRCNVPETTVFVNKEARGTLSRKYQSFSIPWKEIKRSRVTVQTNLTHYKPWLRVYKVKPGDRIDVDITLHPVRPKNPKKTKPDPDDND
ncbi:MAG: serine/threonine protein kinase [Deltaproteobacteria bacterium]|nr:MAG: serine/threonine protein kinase [Deltaproteobacteria bacterium]